MRAFVLLVLTAAIPGTAAAQSDAGQISGFVRDAQQGAYPLQGHCFGPLLEPVVQAENFALARGEVFAKYLRDELSHEFEVRHVLYLCSVNTRKAFAQR